MSYYKLIANGEITDAVKDPVWVKPDRNGRLVRCDVREACGILDKDGETIYQIDGATTLPLDDCKTISVADITQEEYEEILVVLELDGVMLDQSTVIEWTQEEIDEPEEETNLAQAIERKVEIMSAVCQMEIVKGVDVALSDGETKHFDMTVEDQIDLMIAKEGSISGGTALFKASGEDLMEYSLADILLISEAANKHIMYHRAYFESLRKLVRASTSIIEVGNHYYGEDIPEEYCSSVYGAMQS